MVVVFMSLCKNKINEKYNTIKNSAIIMLFFFSFELLKNKMFKAFNPIV